MSLSKKLGGFSLSIGIGLLFVSLVVIGAFYAPMASKAVSRWFVFAGVSGFVFGYQLYDFWRFRTTVRFWLPLSLLFACHFLLWEFYVHPHFGGDPRLFTAFIVTFTEYIFVSTVMKLTLRPNAEKQKFIG
jgi:hypothetical protein